MKVPENSIIWSFIKKQASGTTSDNEWYNEWKRVVQRVKTNDKWQRMATSGTTSDNEWQRETTNGNEWYNEWQRMTTSDNEWYKEWQRMTTSGTKSDNEWKRVTMSDRLGQNRTGAYEWPFFK